MACPGGSLTARFGQRGRAHDSLVDLRTGEYSVPEVRPPVARRHRLVPVRRVI